MLLSLSLALPAITVCSFIYLETGLVRYKSSCSQASERLRNSVLPILNNLNLSFLFVCLFLNVMVQISGFFKGSCAKNTVVHIICLGSVVNIILVVL